MMTKLLEKKHVKLRCPKCGKLIQSAFVCKMDSSIGTRYAFLCGECEKLIGIARKNDYTLLQAFQSA